MAQLVYLKESIKGFYQKHAEYLEPVLKLVLSFGVLYLIQNMFCYSEAANKPWIFLVVSVAQAFLPLSFLFYSASCVMLINLWEVSPEISLMLLALLLISFLVFIRVDSRYAFIIIVTPVLFHLKLEYFLPVLLGMTAGLEGILPMTAGILVYFFSVYIEDANTLLTTTSSLDPGMGMSRIISLLVIDHKLLVILVSFILAAFISYLLYRIFHANAWMFAIIIGNVALAMMLLSGRLIFELDYTMWRVFLEGLAAMAVAVAVQFFKGIGDFSRVEKVSFEDDEYIYYVKAIPKIKVSQKERNVTDIISGDAVSQEEAAEKEKAPASGEEGKKKETNTKETVV